MDAETCVICGEVIPEGLMVCSLCEKYVEQAKPICYNTETRLCESCPLYDKCKYIDPDTLGNIFITLQSRTESVQKKVCDWIKNRFLIKR